VSYDLHLFRPVPGEDHLATTERCLPPEFEKAPIEPAKEALKRKIASALMAHDPVLQIFPLDHAPIAEHFKISSAESALRSRYI
jgi:hypothetical protein